tara:strand:- start:1522 stop:1659 length:138 start_codon:yes stop_codon:yes gene_type:complete
MVLTEINTVFFLCLDLVKYLMRIAVNRSKMADGSFLIMKEMPYEI